MRTGRSSHENIPSMIQVPRISVVIPCYNYGRYLTQCLNSVLMQTGVDTRVLIINDASTDNSKRVAEELAARYSNVELIHHSENMGHISTYNEGLLEWADGDYVILLSADDRLTLGALRRAVQVMENNPSVGMVYGHPFEFVDDTDLPDLAVRERGSSVWTGKEWLAKRFREAVNVVSTPTVVVRGRIQRLVGGYNADLPHAADLEMWLRIALVSDIAYVRGGPQAFYRVHPSSMSQDVYRDRLGDVGERQRVFDSLVAEHGTRLKDKGIDSWAPYRVLASEPLWAAARAYEKGTVASEPIDKWVEFAARCYPDLQSLRAFRAYERRKRLGQSFCHRTQVFFGTVVAMRITNLLWWQRWKYYGA